jgi:hypothetical protein
MTALHLEQEAFFLLKSVAIRRFLRGGNATHEDILRSFFTAEHRDHSTPCASSLACKLS